MIALHIPRTIFDEMVAHCVAGLPDEACGFLSGEGSTVGKIYPLTNAAASPVYYRPSDREMLAAFDHMDQTGQDLLSIFHSHVASPPLPSPTDIREAHYPDAVYLIVSLQDPHAVVAKGWRIKKADWRDETGVIEEVELVVS